MKTPVLESLFNKVVGLQACKFVKNRLEHGYFPLNIAKFLRTPILKNKRFKNSQETSLMKLSIKFQKYGSMKNRLHH